MAKQEKINKPIGFVTPNDNRVPESQEEIVAREEQEVVDEIEAIDQLAGMLGDIKDELRDVKIDLKLLLLDLKMFMIESKELNREWEKSVKNQDNTGVIEFR